MSRIYDSSKEQSGNEPNLFSALWEPGDFLNYLDLDMVVTAIVDAVPTDSPDFNTSCMHNTMIVEYLNYQNEIQTKVFYEHHIPVLKKFN